MKIKVSITVCILTVLSTLQGCMNPQNLNARAYGPDCPKMILPDSSDDLFAAPACMLSIRVTDNTSQILSETPIPSRVFIRKEGSTTEYPIDSYIDQGGLVGLCMYKHAPTRNQPDGSEKTVEQLLMLKLSPGTYWVSGIVFCGYTGRTELTKESSGFRIEGASCQYIGCLDLTVTKRDKNMLFGDKLLLNGKFEQTKFKMPDFEWAEKEYGTSRINAFRK